MLSESGTVCIVYYFSTSIYMYVGVVLAVC